MKHIALKQRIDLNKDFKKDQMKHPLDPKDRYNTKQTLDTKTWP